MKVLLIISLTGLLLLLCYTKIETEVDVLYFHFGFIILVCSILMLTIKSHADKK